MRGTVLNITPEQYMFAEEALEYLSDTLDSMISASNNLRQSGYEVDTSYGDLGDILSDAIDCVDAKIVDIEEILYEED